MFVIEVIPLKRGVHVGSLSYFSAHEYPLGTIIKVPIRNSQAAAVVLNTKPVSSTKTALKAATFSLKKLPLQTDTQAVSPELIQTAEQLSSAYASTPGAILYHLLPTEVRNGDITLPHTHHVKHDEDSTPEILQAVSSERYVAYRSLVRETFAHSGSVLCIVPSAADIASPEATLGKGIEPRVITLSSTLTKSQLKKSFAALEDFTHPKLIIATPNYAFIERHDITTVILEHARSPHYKERTRPYLDIRDAVKEHAKQTGRRVVYGDLLLRTEDEIARRDERYSTNGETPKRLALSGNLTIVNQKDKPDAKVPFQLFHPSVIEALKETRKEKKKSFLLAARRGLAPVVACGDCGYIFRSPHSGSPYSLVRTKKGDDEQRWFVDGVSGERIRADDTCPECGSWRLRERGIGIQHVYDELSRELDGEPIILFDHLTAKTFKRANFLSDTFYSTKGAILLGTQMALPYLTKPFETSVIVNHDALRATPTWRQQEDNFATLLRLREITEGSLFVQTRTGHDDITTYAKTGAVEKFYNDEIQLRQTFNYPPYTRFIHLTWQGTTTSVKQTDAMVHKALDQFDVSVYSAPPVAKGPNIHYGLIRYPSIDWPNKKLIGVLQTLPPHIRVVMNPDRIV